MEAHRKCRFAQILCRPLRSISPLRGHFRLGENPGDSAGMALSVNDFATFVLHSGRVKKYHRTHRAATAPIRHLVRVCGGRWFFLRLRGQYLRGKNPDDYAKTALGEDPSGPFVFFQPVRSISVGN